MRQLKLFRNPRRVKPPQLSRMEKEVLLKTLTLDAPMGAPGAIQRARQRLRDRGYIYKTGSPLLTAAGLKLAVAVWGRLCPKPKEKRR